MVASCCRGVWAFLRSGGQDSGEPCDGRPYEQRRPAGELAAGRRFVGWRPPAVAVTYLTFSTRSVKFRPSGVRGIGPWLDS